jgi:hypothetical protein
MMVSADHAGTVILWDSRAALLAAKDVGPGSVHGESADRLWDSISDPDPVHGYQAGMELLDRHLRISRAAVLAPLIPVNDQGNPGRIHLLIASLSSTVQSEREKAHKSLEGLGTAAIGQIRAALAAHPGGELEERLKDIAHVIGADDPATPTPPAISSAPPLADPQTLRTARVIQLLEWSDDPKAAEQLARLSPPLTGRGAELAYRRADSRQPVEEHVWAAVMEQQPNPTRANRKTFNYFPGCLQHAEQLTAPLQTRSAPTPPAPIPSVADRCGSGISGRSRTRTSAE